MLQLCPKCNSTLANYRGFSRCSGLNQTNGEHATIIQGQSCLICGTWVEEDFKVVCPLPAKNTFRCHSQENFVRGKSTKQQSLDVMNAVARAFKEVAELRQCGASWKVIQAALKLPGSQVVIKRSYQEILRRQP